MAGCGVLTILTQFDVVHSLFASLRSCIKLCDVVCKFTGIDVKSLSNSILSKLSIRIRFYFTDKAVLIHSV